MNEQETVRKQMDTFFTQTNCDRCKKSLQDGRITSWFNEETICLECSDKERKYKQKLRDNGIDPSNLEGIGYVPTIQETK